MNLNKMTDRLCEEREKIERTLNTSTHGLTPLQIADRTNLSIGKVREHLQTMKGFKHVSWFAEWYGRNAGYARKYVLTAKGKLELKGV